MGKLVAALTFLAALALPALALAQTPTEPLYCQPDSPSGALNDSEHTVLVGDPKLPRGARQYRITVDGITTTVTEAGRRNAKEAVVFAHGVPEYSRDFDRLMTGASRYGRAIEFDWPGLGHADDRAGGPYDLDGAAKFFGDVLARLGVTKVDLVMHDFGGPWALQWAKLHPNQLHSVVIINSGVLIGYLGHPDAFLFFTPGVGEADMATTTRQAFDADIQAHNPKPFPAGFLDRMYDNYDRATRCAILRYYRDMGTRGPDAVGRAQAAVLAKRRRPALVVWGAKDPYIPTDEAYKQSQAFPGDRVVILDDAGHWPFVDDPKRVDRIVLPFLRRVLR